MKNYKEITREDFLKLSADEKAELLNNGLSDGLSLQAVCDGIGISRKDISERLRKQHGYVFQKHGEVKQFIKANGIIEESKEPTKTAPATKKEQPKQEVKKVVNHEPKKENRKAEYSFDFYYKPAGSVKKIGASVDIEVLKEFEALCNKYNFINVSAHVSNALALYVQELNSK